MFLTFQTTKVSPLGERLIHINVFDILSIKTASIRKKVVWEWTEIGLKPDVLVNTEDNEKQLEYVIIDGNSENVRELVNVTLNEMRNRKV